MIDGEMQVVEVPAGEFPPGWGWYVGQLGNVGLRDGRVMETGLLTAVVYRRGGESFRATGATAVEALDAALFAAQRAGVDVPGVSILLGL